MFRSGRIALAALVVVPALLGLTGRSQSPESFTLVIGGNTAGYLSPCGCTSPMTGGIRRRAALTRLLAKDGAVVLETGPLVDGPGRQSELKAETLAESLKAMGVDALALAAADVNLGPGQVDAILRLSDAPSVSRPDDEPTGSGPLLIYGDLGPPRDSVEVAIARAQRLAEQAEQEDRPSLYVTQHGIEVARSIARAVPQLSAVVYRSETSPIGQDELIGKTRLLSPGPHSQFVIAVQWDGSGFSKPAVYPLGPEVENDPAIERYYGRYLDRVRSEKLVEMMPKSSDAAYAGTAACRSCHSPEYAIWADSKHSHAFKTLVDVNHDADPDCVSCHVVGAESTGGFISKERTPKFVDVGCESCHGPAKAHVANPRERPMPHIDQKSCAGCHNLQNSPNFDFEKYWSKIRH